MTTNFTKFGFEFALSNGVKASEIIGMLNPAIEIQAAHIQAVRNLCDSGESYSGEIGDVLCSAVAATSRTEVRDFERAWVDLMLSNAKAEWLRDHGFAVGPRLATRNPGHAGIYMVADESYCIVGDNLSELVEEAYQFWFDEIEDDACPADPDGVHFCGCGCENSDFA